MRGYMPPRRRDNVLLRNVGARVREVRAQRGQTQEVLAAKAGLQPTTVSRIEGGRAAVSLATLGALAEALSVPLASLVTSAGSEGMPADEPRRDTELSRRERRLVGLMRKLPTRGQDALIGVAEAMASAGTTDGGSGKSG